VCTRTLAHYEQVVREEAASVCGYTGTLLANSQAMPWRWPRPDRSKPPPPPRAWQTLTGTSLTSNRPIGISLSAPSADVLSATLYGHSTWRPLSHAER